MRKRKVILAVLLNWSETECACACFTVTFSADNHSGEKGATPVITTAATATRLCRLDTLSFPFFLSLLSATAHIHRHNTIKGKVSRSIEEVSHHHHLFLPFLASFSIYLLPPLCIHFCTDRFLTERTMQKKKCNIFTLAELMSVLFHLSHQMFSFSFRE